MSRALTPAANFTRRREPTDAVERARNGHSAADRSDRSFHGCIVASHAAALVIAVVTSLPTSQDDGDVEAKQQRQPSAVNRQLSVGGRYGRLVFPHVSIFALRRDENWVARRLMSPVSLCRAESPTKLAQGDRAISPSARRGMASSPVRVLSIYLSRSLPCSFVCTFVCPLACTLVRSFSVLRYAHEMACHRGTATVCV